MSKRVFWRTGLALLLVLIAVPLASPARVAPGTRDMSGGVATIVGYCGTLCGQTIYTSVAGVGDVNGDGLDDTAVVDERRGKVFFFFGPRPQEATYAYDNQADAVFDFPGQVSSPANSESRDVVSPAGDLDRDGHVDVLVGVPRGFFGINTVTGLVYVIHGPILRGTHFSPSANTVSTIVGEAGSQAGASVAAVGDVNGDAKGDILVGAPGLNSGTGGAYLVLDPAPGVHRMPTDAAAKLVGTRTAGSAGWSVAGGRGLLVNSPTRDLVVGAPGADVDNARDEGVVYVVPGSVRGTVNLEGAGATFVGEHPFDFAGWSVAVGQLIGDQWPDLVIGAPEPSGEPGPNNGIVYIVPGPLSPGAHSLPERLTNKLVGYPASGSGWSVAVGQFSEDNAPDLAVGAPFAHKVYVQYGPISPSMPNLEASTAIRVGSNIGRWVASAGDVDGQCGGGIDVLGDPAVAYVIDQSECGPVSSQLYPISVSVCQLISLDPRTCPISTLNRDLIYGRLHL